MQKDFALDISILINSERFNFNRTRVNKSGPAAAVQYDLGCSYADTAHFGGT